MKKDITIKRLITILDTDKKLEFIKIVDYWEADECSIGLSKNNLLIYISTYNYINNEKVRYDIDLEILNKDEYKVLEKKRGVSESQLLKIIENFFFQK